MTRRPFSILDAMILIAATAVGLALIRLNFSGHESVGLGPTFRSRLQFSLLSLWPMPAAWSLAVVGLSLIPPRPTCRRLFRSPGFAACATAIFVLLWVGLLLGIEAYIEPKHSVMMLEPFCMWFLRIRSDVCIAIGAVWISIAASGGWRRSRPLDWCDRLGQVLGWSWIALDVGVITARFFRN